MMLVTQNLCSYKAVTASRNVLTVSQGRLAVMGWKVMTGVATVVGLLLGLGTLASAVATNWATARIYALPITGGVFYVLLASISVWDYRHRQAPWTTEGLVNWPVPLVILGGLLGVAFATEGVRGAVGVARYGGTIVLVGSLVMAPLILYARYETAQGSQKPCPDCAETVKRDARVCRHCGYRWAPMPDERDIWSP